LEATRVPKRNILMISSEAVPFSKTGGLGDVAGALPRALARLGHRVTLVVPRYRASEPGTIVERLPLTIAGRTFEAAFMEHPIGEGATAVLVDCPELYDRAELYGVGNNDYPDNAVRFAFLARAALEFAGRSAPRPDLVHAHDWQAGLAPVYLKTLYASHPALAGVASVFTIHNLAYQGLFPPVWLPALDLGWELFSIEGMEYWGKISFLKGGVNFSEMVTTVSPRYAKEIQAAEFGFGFDGILRGRAGQVCGILNGIDTEYWDPAHDRFLPAGYDAGNLKPKQLSRRALLDACGVPITPEILERPIVGMVSRMVDQKGFDLLAELGASRLLSLDATYVALGSGEASYEDMWRRMAAEHPGRVAARIGFDEGLAHLVEGGSDIFLMPSRFEPCGLNQMYSLRYGTVPVVRAVGGLDDTIENWVPRTRKGTGFKFRDYSADALFRCLQKAVSTFRDRTAWQALQAEGMKQDHSWDASARQYGRAYERAIRRLRSQGSRIEP
jgi:starch synthase